MEEEWIEVVDKKKRIEQRAVGGKYDYSKVKCDKNEFKNVFPKVVLKRGEPLMIGGASAMGSMGASVSTGGNIVKSTSNQAMNSKPKAVIVNKAVDNLGSKPQKRQPVALFDLILAPKVKQSKPENVIVKPSISNKKGIDRESKTKHKLGVIAYYDENNKLAMRSKKKKFSIIKKKILLERLNRYIKMKQAEVAATPVLAGGQSDNEVLCILNFVHTDELQDNDERKEIEDNIKEIVAPFGSVISISFGPGAGYGGDDHVVYVKFDSISAASTAAISLNGFVIGGNAIKAYTTSSSQVLLSSFSGDDSSPSDGDDDHVLISSTAVDTAEVAAVVCLENLVFECDVTDADETNEMLQDVRRLCSGKDDYLTSIWIESVAGAIQVDDKPAGKSIPLATPWGVVEYFSVDTAVSRCRQLHGLIIGGDRIEAYIYDYELYRQSIFTDEGLIHSTDLSNEYRIKILGFIEDAQVEDEDEASDIKAELHKLLSDLIPDGAVDAVQEIVFIPSTSPINYHDTIIALHLSLESCLNLMGALEGLEIGGVKLEYQLVVGSDPLRVVCDTNKNSVLVLKNFINDDDIIVASVNPLTHDPSGFYSHSEELVAIKIDLLTLAKGDDVTHPVVKRLFVESSNSSRPSARCLPVCIGFSSLSVAEEIMIYFEGTMIGGGVIKSFLRRTDDSVSRHDYVASVSIAAKHALLEQVKQLTTSEHTTNIVAPLIAKAEEEETPNILDAVQKFVVSKYVEAATAPKQPRHTSVCMMSVKTATEEIDKLIQTTLNTLAGYQKRLKENEPLKVKQKMRFVCGLKQCINGVKSERAILLLLATDTEESEALDSKLDDLIREAQTREIPILFCLSRRKLAKSILASTRQAAVAVYNADGVFKEVQRIVQYAKAPAQST